MVGRQPSPARAPSPARGGKDGGGDNEGRSEGTSPLRSRYRLSINKGRLSPVITPVMRGIRRIRRSASTGRTARREEDHHEDDHHNSSPSKIPSRLPFFHGHPPTASAASQSIARAPPSHDAPHPDLPQPPPSRRSQSDSSSSASPMTPPLPLSPVKKNPQKPAHAQPHRQPSPSVSRSPTPTPQEREVGVSEAVEERRHETQTMTTSHQQHGDDNRMTYATRFRLHKGLSGLDKKSLDSMDQIKKDIMEMRTHRRKVKFTGNDDRSSGATTTAPQHLHAAEAHDGGESAQALHSSSKFSEPSSLSTFKSPQPQSRASILSISTPSNSSGLQRYHSKSSSSATPKRKMGLGEITMRDLDLSFVRREWSDRSLDAELQKEIKEASLKKEIRKARKLIKRTCKEIWTDKDKIVEMQRNNWQIRKRLMNDHGIPKETVTALNMKIEKVVRQEREVDASLEKLQEEKHELETQCGNLARAIGQMKDLLEELHVQVVPLLPPPDASGYVKSPSTSSSKPSQLIDSKAMDDTIHSTSEVAGKAPSMRPPLSPG